MTVEETALSGDAAERRLEVEGLCAGYGSMEAVTNVSLRVDAGEIVTIVGRNGAGKTTALFAVAGIRHGRSAGRVLLLGSDVSTMAAPAIVARGLAHVPEGHRVFRTLTVEENLRLGAYPQRKAPRASFTAKLERVFELFPILSSFGQRPAGLLSGGQQQMIAIGQALMSEPEVLLLDEPTSGLALPIVRDILQVLSQLRTEGMAILLVEQNVNRALAHSDRCYVMERGRVVLSGSSAALRADDTVAQIVAGLRDSPAAEATAGIVIPASAP